MPADYIQAEMRTALQTIEPNTDARPSAELALLT